jgi:MoaA/NifB/PqqE/SkfB family radical SAM enzyme
VKTVFTQVDEGGNLKIPPEIVREMGFAPGARVKLSRSADRLVVHRPVSTIARVYVEPTTRCNLKCRTCMRNVWEEPIGDMNERTLARILMSIEALPHPPTVFFGGLGEPLTHPGIVDMVKRVKRLGSPAEAITNGLLLDERRAEELIRAGLDSLWVSIDGASPECYGDVRPEGSLPDVVENLKTLRDLKVREGSQTPQIGISFVAMKRNAAEFPEVLRLGYRMGARKFLVTNVYPHTQDLLEEILYMRSIGEPMGSRAKIAIPRMDLKKETIEILETAMEGHYGAQLEGLELLFPSDTCPFAARGSVAVRWDGKVSPCLPLLHTHVNYLGDRLRVNYSYSLGSILDHSLPDLWNNPEYTQLRGRLEEFDFSPCTICNSCEMANDNERDCFGNMIPACGGCLWAQGFIQCP